MESNTFGLQPQAVSIRRSYLIFVGSAHGYDMSTYRINHVYRSRIGILSEHWSVIIHIHHQNSDMSSCLENKMVSCGLECLSDIFPLFSCARKYKSGFENAIVKHCVRFNFVSSISEITTGL